MTDEQKRIDQLRIEEIKAEIRKIADEINSRGADQYLQPDRVGGYICPICGSGSGDSGSGLTTKDGEHFTCWAKSCFMSADLIDIIGLQYGLTRPLEKARKAAELYNLGQLSEIKTKPRVKAEIVEEEQQDYTDYFLQANQRIGQTDYPQRRGLSAATIERFKLGYDPAWISPTRIENAKTEINGYIPPPSPRFIIPTGRGNYLARDTRAERTDRFIKMKEGRALLFNTEALQQVERPVFIVEGEIDAMSITEAGGESIALGSASNWKKLILLLEEHRPAQPLILVPDNDTAGQNAIDNIAAELDRLNIPYYRAGALCGACNDPNAALMEDRAAFIAAVQHEQERAKDIMNANKEATSEGTLEAKADSTADEANTDPSLLYTDKGTDTSGGIDPQAEKDNYQAQSAAGYINAFKDGIIDSVNTPAIPTGFYSFDQMLDGGLYEGLYIIGAISSLGKTTFVLQAADQIAASGQDVLVFSLEMARFELMAKSISRLTFTGAAAKNMPRSAAKTTRGITAGKKYSGYSEDEKQLIKSAVNEYDETISRHIWIFEGRGKLGVVEIDKAVTNHISMTGRRPVVFIDYLQILSPHDMRSSDKQNTDIAVLELKRISRDNKIPVIGISSFNRDNYTAPVNMAAFKESGAIEYSSDVLIGLQYQGMDYKEDEKELARSNRIRKLFKDNDEAAKLGNGVEIDLKILKNRNGVKGTSDPLTFYPMFNIFAEHPSGFTVVNDPTRR